MGWFNSVFNVRRLVRIGLILVEWWGSARIRWGGRVCVSFIRFGWFVVVLMISVISVFLLLV